MDFQSIVVEFLDQRHKYLKDSEFLLFPSIIMAEVAMTYSIQQELYHSDAFIEFALNVRFS